MPSPRSFAALAAVALCLAGPEARAQAPGRPSGAALARRVADARPEDLRARLAEVVALPAREQDAFVGAVGARREAGPVGGNLVAALGLLATPAAVDELGALVRAGTEESNLALDTLLTLPPGVALPALVASLDEGNRKVRARCLERLGQELRAAPEPVAAALADALTSRPALEAALAEVVAAAVGTAELGLGAPLVAALEGRAAEAPALGVGLARGAGRRIAALRAAAAEGDEASATASLRLGLEVPACLDLLARLAKHAAPAVRAEVFRSLPVLVEALDDDAWAARLFDALDRDDRAERDQAWATLRRLTGEDHPQASPAWRAWWARRRGS